MKKTILSAMLVAGLSANAYDYPYLAIQASDGTLTALSVESLELTVSGSQLIAVNESGTQAFSLSDLSKMFFSADGTASGISETIGTPTEAKCEYYDLHGRKLTEMPRKGMFIVKTDKGTFKVNRK